MIEIDSQIQVSDRESRYTVHKKEQHYEVVDIPVVISPRWHFITIPIPFALLSYPQFLMFQAPFLCWNPPLTVGGTSSITSG